MVEWNRIFDEAKPATPASEQDIFGLRSFLCSELTDSERNEIAVQINPFRQSTREYMAWCPVDPTKWTLPECDLPADFKDFLRWSNGGWARTGEREFGFFGIAGIRNYMLWYLFPEYLPGVVPFAFNGGGIFYAFDVRDRPQQGEFPIIAVATGVLDFEYSPVIGTTFVDVCRGTVNIDDILYPPPVEPPLPDRGDLWIIKQPNSLKDMASIKKLLELNTSLGELRVAMTNTPCRLAINIPCNYFNTLLTASPELRSFLAVTELDNETLLEWP